MSIHTRAARAKAEPSVGSWAVLGLLALLGSLHPASAGAEDLCVSRAFGVPGLQSGPQWTDTGASAARPKKTNLDDPRWAGATRRYFPDRNGNTPEVTLRAVAEGDSILLSMQVLADPGATMSDTVWIGFGKSDAVASTSAADFDDFLVKLSLGGNTVVNAGALTGGSQVVSWKRPRGGATWTLDNALSPVDYDSARYWVGGTTAAVRWAVNLKLVNLAAQLGALPLKIFAAAFVTTTPGQARFHIWPPAAVALSAGQTTNFSESNVNAASNWNNITSFGGFPACADGISLGWNQVGTNSPSTQRIFTPADPPPPGNQNVFFAQPSWNSVPIANGRIKARFRLANWGSVAAVDAPWDDLFGSDRPENTGARIERSCAIGSGLCGGILPAGNDPHQCMLVELEKGSNPGVDPVKFANDSVYRNMDFVDASRFERNATISIKGLEALPGTTHRDVFIYVKTINMPPVGGSPIWPDAASMRRALDLLTADPRQAPQHPNPDRMSRDRVMAARIAVDRGVLDPVLSKDIYEHMSSSWPTYEVYVYDDTGRDIIVDGRKYRLLESQLPFGYFVSHDGALYGWEHAVAGVEGAVLQELAPNYYHVKVPNDGAVKIRTSINAVETPRGTSICSSCCPPVIDHMKVRPGCYCSFVGGQHASPARLLLALGLAAVAALILTRRRRR